MTVSLPVLRVTATWYEPVEDQGYVLVAAHVGNYPPAQARQRVQAIADNQSTFLRARALRDPGDAVDFQITASIPNRQETMFVDSGSERVHVTGPEFARAVSRGLADRQAGATGTFAALVQKHSLPKDST